jgi:ELWxxDGT repeat protein
MKTSAGQRRLRRGQRLAAVTLAACLGLLILGSGQALALGKPYLVKDINLSGDSKPVLIGGLGGDVFFAANDGSHGTALWKSDGTQAGTVLVKDIDPGRFSAGVVLGDEIYFDAVDGVHGVELWKSDGTADGTVLVKDIEAGSGDSFPTDLTVYDGEIFFTANDGTQPLAHGIELWKTDGTGPGTTMVKDINPGPFSARPVDLTASGGSLFFSADDGSHGIEMWKTNGTPAGTALVKDIESGAGSSNAGNFTSVFAPLSGASTLFFSAKTGGIGYGLWKSDGTEAGTVLVKDLPDGSLFTFPENFVNASGRLFFGAPASESEIGTELWTSNGTEDGTILVREINPGPFGSLYDDLGPLPVNGSVFFTAADYVNSDLTGNWELWKSDGTEAGTVLVKEIAPGSDGSLPANYMNLSGTLIFTADDGTDGRTVWQSDGTEPGTVMVSPIPFGVRGARLVGNRVFIAGSDAVHGEELWAASTLPPAELVALKRCVPTGDAGSFRFSVYRSGESEALDSATVACGDSHTFELPDTGDYDVIETAGDGSTSLGSYSTVAGGDCSLVEDEGDFRVASVSLVNGQTRSCSFTNTNETVKSSLVVTKVCSAKAHDRDRFQVALNGNGAGDPLDCGGSLTLTLEPDTAYVVTEAAAGTTDLADYDVSYDGCSGSGIARGGTAPCTITNTLKPKPVVTVTKACPNGKQSPEDRFGVVLNGTVTGDVLDCGGSVQLTLEPRASYDVTEQAASTTATLLNYSVAYVGCQGGGLPRGAAATCSITNTRLTARNQPQGPGYWKNHQAQLSMLLPVVVGGYPVSTAPAATAVFNSMNCSSTKDVNVAGCLAGHLLAAKLNVKNGADNCINPVIAQADALLAAVGYAGPGAQLARPLTPAERTLAVRLKSALDKYDNGGGC